MNHFHSVKDSVEKFEASLSAFKNSVGRKLENVPD